MRSSWANMMLAKKHHAACFLTHAIWLDPCSSIVPATPRTIFDNQMASYGKAKRWVSDDATGNSRSLRSSPYAGKQAHRGDAKLWWFLSLTRGKVHVEIMPEGWVQNGAGQAQLVSRLPGILDKMLGRNADKPDVVFTDRGLDFTTPRRGRLTQSTEPLLRRTRCSHGQAISQNGNLPTWQTSSFTRRLCRGSALIYDTIR